MYFFRASGKKTPEPWGFRILWGCLDHPVLRLDVQPIERERSEIVPHVDTTNEVFIPIFGEFPYIVTAQLRHRIHAEERMERDGEHRLEYFPHRTLSAVSVFFANSRVDACQKDPGKLFKYPRIFFSSLILLKATDDIFASHGTSLSICFTPFPIQPARQGLSIINLLPPNHLPVALKLDRSLIGSDEIRNMETAEEIKNIDMRVAITIF